MAKFKAKITFAAGENMYYPFEEQYEAPDELVKSWIKVGYVEEIEEPAPMIQTVIKETKKVAAKTSKKAGK